MSTDLTHEEARAAFLAFQGEVGGKAQLYVSLNSMSSGKDALSVSIYPFGIANSSKGHLGVSAKTYRDLLAAAQEVWAERCDTYAAETIRKMALAIISITADQGECTDAALRAEFDAGDVKRFADRALERANEMASNGPFSIVRLTGANDAQAA